MIDVDGHQSFSGSVQVMLVGLEGAGEVARSPVLIDEGGPRRPGAFVGEVFIDLVNGGVQPGHVKSMYDPGDHQM
jgi:hypothetical protein